jgi:nitrile hydratase
VNPSPESPGSSDDSEHEHEHGHDHSAHGHDHDHGGEHEHDSLVVEDDEGNLLGQQMVSALQALLIRRRILSAGEVALEIQNLEAPGTHLGARIVARAWVDSAYRQRLLENGKNGAAELKIKVGEAQLVVVENTPDLHNVVVCTLCSCYPRSILGQPPAWYISKAYRARTVREPASVLAEFGLTLPPTTAILVHDSNADMRFLVLPQRPEGTEHLSEDDLARLVTRDSMIGVSQALMTPTQETP